MRTMWRSSNGRTASRKSGRAGKMQAQSETFPKCCARSGGRTVGTGRWRENPRKGQNRTHGQDFPDLWAASSRRPEARQDDGSAKSRNNTAMVARVSKERVSGACLPRYDFEHTDYRTIRQATKAPHEEGAASPEACRSARASFREARISRLRIFPVGVFGGRPWKTTFLGH